jgi:hypothetical protein
MKHLKTDQRGHWASLDIEINNNNNNYDNDNNNKLLQVLLW